jgi:hypothetical protein
MCRTMHEVCCASSPRHRAHQPRLPVRAGVANRKQGDAEVVPAEARLDGGKKRTKRVDKTRQSPSVSNRVCSVIMPGLGQ